ncbi:unnamed protein product [Diplocarpon coronariae]
MFPLGSSPLLAVVRLASDYCTFTTAAAARAGKTACKSIILDGITVDACVTLDLTDLADGTSMISVRPPTRLPFLNRQVVFQEGTTTREYEEWNGIMFPGGTCSGGHGFDNTVSDVTIASSTISGSSNGVRVKIVSGATGPIRGVTYKDSKLSSTDYGIVIRPDYENGSPTGKPTDGVLIIGLTISGVSGTVESGAENILILCASCSDWTWYACPSPLIYFLSHAPCPNELYPYSSIGPA